MTHTIPSLFLLCLLLSSLATKKRKQAKQGEPALNGSVKKRMELFSGGKFRREGTIAAASLYENGYENEPSFVEMRDPDDRRFD